MKRGKVFLEAPPNYRPRLPPFWQRPIVLLASACLRSVTSGPAELFVDRRPPDHIRSDNGSEFTAKAVREWLARVGVKTLYIAPGSPWENGYT